MGRHPGGEAGPSASFAKADPDSVLFVTLDSCRFDTFEEADVPNMRAIGPLHEAWAPSHFTLGSHAAMFVGFTPGIATRREPYVNPKYGRIFRLAGGGPAGPGGARFRLEGETIVEGFANAGYRTLGSGAVLWFNGRNPPGRVLGRHFEEFFYPGDTFSLRRQLQWLAEKLSRRSDKPVFVFLNVGETHDPYYFEGAAWDVAERVCVPFADGNDAEACRVRQRASLEFADRELGPLLDAFADSSVVLCSDHGECWGEDGLWGHGIYHEAVMRVPLLFRLTPERPLERRRWPFPRARAR